ncbi:MAG: DUF445 domain-containing protein, partial [Candidatus Rifleibacteriota bacterium]
MNENIWLSLAISALLGGFIGWTTNWLAIKALFHPKQPFKFLFFEFQGLLPKRQVELAKSLGKIVEGELINVEELIRRVDPADLDSLIEDQMRKNREETQKKVADYINGYLQKIPLIKITANTHINQIMDFLERQVVDALKKQVPEMLDKAAKKAAEKISVQEIVFEKISKMDLDKLEGIFNKIADREMEMIIRL